MRHKKLSKISALFILLGPLLQLNNVFADDLQQFRLSGFGTMGFVKTNTDDAEFVPSPDYSRGASTSPDWLIDSAIGAQATGDFSNNLSGTLQLISKRDLGHSYSPSTQWAFLAYRFNNHITARAGRLGSPYFMVSDYRNINAANPWVRPTIDVYGQVPFSYEDGVDLIIRSNVGKSRLTVQPFYGKSKNKLWWGAAVTAKINPLWGLNASLEQGPYTLRIGHAAGNLTIADHENLNLILDGLRNDLLTAFCSECSARADHFEVINKNVSFQDIGFQGDWPRMLIMAEYTRRLAPGFAPDTNAWYLTGAYRFGKISPYLTLSKVIQTSAKQDNTVPNLPIEEIQLLRDGINQTLSDVGQQTRGIGIRWDLTESLDFKTQLDHVSVANTSVGGYNVDVKPGFSGHYNALSVTLDFEF